jgi:hypothetical protein
MRIKSIAFICCLVTWVVGLAYIAISNHQDMGFMLGFSSVVGARAILHLFDT